MIFKNFRIQVVIRIISLTLTLFLSIYLFLNTDLYATIGILGLLCIYQVVAMIKLMETSNRRMLQFLEAIRYADFSQSFKTPGLGKSFNELNEGFSMVIRDFQRIRGEKEENYRYLQTVVQHVGIGLIAYDNQGKVELMNTAAKRILGVPKVRNISALGTINEELVRKLLSMKTGNRDLIKIQQKEDILQLVVYTTRFQLRGRLLILASLQNIQSELEEQEMEAWQKLIRVLTHEIMNSITPISSLAQTIDQSLIEMINEVDEAKDLNEIHQAVSTIQKRSEGLIHFVNSYHKLTRIPKPNFQMISINNLFNRVTQLMENESNKRKVKITSVVQPQNLQVIADQELIEQVLLNLIRNSLEAINNKENGKLDLSASRDEKGRVMMRLTDNGSGIVPEVREKIFIPFFTTKKTGSGIGLSLSKQIMRQHAGTISVSSIPDKQTTFKLTFS